MSPISVLVADDEPLARRRLQLALAQMSDVRFVGFARDGEEAVEVHMGRHMGGEAVEHGLHLRLVGERGPLRAPGGEEGGAAAGGVAEVMQAVVEQRDVSSAQRIQQA